MALLYSNENVSMRLVEALRAFGHDVLTSQEAGNANMGIDDPLVLAFAERTDRVLLTNNRKDFIRLHRLVQPHKGLIVYTIHRDAQELARRIGNALADDQATGRFLARVHGTGHSFD